MKDYFLNIQDTYRRPVEQFTQTRESFTKIRAGLKDLEKNSELEVYAKSFSSQSVTEADIYRLGTTTLKLSALPLLAVSAYIIGKVAYSRQFSYKGLLLAGITFAVGHDLSKMGHNLQKVHVMEQSAVKEEEERRDLGHTLSPKQSAFLINVLFFVVSKPIALTIGDENMDHEAELLSGKSLNGLICEDAVTALKGTVSEDIIVSINELIFG